jgi:hypothetical protein
MTSRNDLLTESYIEHGWPACRLSMMKFMLRSKESDVTHETLALSLDKADKIFFDFDWIVNFD